jgi:hypothetical protein
MKKYIHTILCTGAMLILASCGHAEAEVQTEQTEVIQTATETEKASEIATERVTISTEAVSEIATEEKTDPPKMVFTSELKTAERVAVTTEEVTGEINEDGYGWVQLQYSAEYHIREDHLTKENGSIDVFGHHETWYSTNEASGKVTAWEIPEKHIADDGTIRDEDGYICVASSDHKKHEIVMTSVGPGKVYDTGCSHGTIDVYTNW